MSMFNTTLALSLAVCVGGLIWRLRQWSRLCVRKPCPPWTVRLRRSLSAMRNGVRISALKAGLQALGANVLLQLHLARQSRMRWLIHFSIFFGFVLLVLFHAMDGVISYDLLPGYEPTLNPYQFLRNFLGALVLAGALAAVIRRMCLRSLRRVSKAQDWFALALISGVICSGFALEAVKMLSPSVFDEMVEEYYPMPEQEEYLALQNYWAAEYGVVFSGLEKRPDLIELGAEVNESSCASCHSPTQSAFLSYPLAQSLRNAAPALDALRADRVLWYVHILLTFIGLACIPFSKFFHLLTTPLNLIARSTKEDVRESAASEKLPAFERALGIDACTHCGACSLHCSVAPIFTALGNPDILPSEKLRTLRRVALGEMDGRDLAPFAEGCFICTECLRCTEVCPSHIGLQDLWLASKQNLAAREQAEPHGLMVRRTASEWAAIFKDFPQAPPQFQHSVNLTDHRESFWACIQCTTCTSVCPVVAVADDPVQELDLTPQQIMNLLRMGLKDLALGSRMVWSCVTCYKCQENCPQGIKVADVLYELRNIAADRLRDGWSPPRPGRRTEP